MLGVKLERHVRRTFPAHLRAMKYYFLSLCFQPLLYELLMGSLVKAGDFSRLAYFIQSGNIVDSKTIVSSSYPKRSTVISKKQPVSCEPQCPHTHSFWFCSKVKSQLPNKTRAPLEEVDFPNSMSLCASGKFVSIKNRVVNRHCHLTYCWSTG